MARGRLVTLEGGEGAGKSTQAAVIAQWLRARGHEVMTTREPGGTPLAEAIRGLVLGNWDETVSAPTELLLMFAARATHLHNRIEPALAAGTDVVCDRFVDASWAYQGAGRGIDAAHLHALEALVLGALRPDLTLVFDIAPEQGLARAQVRGEGNRFEEETLAFMQRVRARYLERAAAAPQRYVVIDASLALDSVSAQVRRALEQRLA